MSTTLIEAPAEFRTKASPAAAAGSVPVASESKTSSAIRAMTETGGTAAPDYANSGGPSPVVAEINDPRIDRRLVASSSAG